MVVVLEFKLVNTGSPLPDTLTAMNNRINKNTKNPRNMSKVEKGYTKCVEYKMCRIQSGT